MNQELEHLMPLVWRFLVVGVLIFFNGFFVAAEFALVKIRDSQLQPLIDQIGRAHV